MRDDGWMRKAIAAFLCDDSKGMCNFIGRKEKKINEMKGLAGTYGLTNVIVVVLAVYSGPNPTWTMNKPWKCIPEYLYQTNYSLTQQIHMNTLYFSQLQSNLDRP